MIFSIQSGIYNLPQHIRFISAEFYSQQTLNKAVCENSGNLKISAGFNGFAVRAQGGSHFFRLEGMIRGLKNTSFELGTLAIVLKSDSECFVFSTKPQEKPELSIHFKKDSSNKGFIGLIPLGILNHVPYQIALCYQDQVAFYDRFIDQTGSPVFEKNN